MNQKFKSLKEIRIGRGLSQEQLSVDSDVSLRTIQRIENGETTGKEKTLQKIADALNISFELISPQRKVEQEEANNKLNKNKSINSVLLLLQVLAWTVIGCCIGIILAYLVLPDLVEVMMVLFSAIALLFSSRYAYNKWNKQ